ELSGKRAGIFAAASSNVANAFFVTAGSNGASPLTILAIAPAACPFDFINALRAAIGSSCARTAAAPKANTATAAIAEADFIKSSLQLNLPVSGKHHVRGLIPSRRDSRRRDHEIVIRITNSNYWFFWLSQSLPRFGAGWPACRGGEFGSSARARR